MPRAARATRAAWRDVRLWLGVALAALSVVGGSRLLAAADETVTVWRATEDLQPGLPLDPDASRLAFADPEFLLRSLRDGLYALQKSAGLIGVPDVRFRDHFQQARSGTV